MDMRTPNRLGSFLGGATASASIIIAISLLTGAKAPPTKFEEIDVGRINIREPDGTLRLVISNRSQFPGEPKQGGGEKARPDRNTFAGMLFVNDEGEENGGLIQRGQLGPDGKADAGLSLTFDRYHQDQVLQLQHIERAGRNFSAIAINDEPDGTVFPLEDRVKALKDIDALPPAEAKAAMQKLRQEGKLPANRLRIGTTLDRASALALSDAKGRPRLMLMVSADGTPSIQFFDENGKVAKTVALDEPGK
jgi:hypothetical protein